VWRLDNDARPMGRYPKTNDSKGSKTSPLNDAPAAVILNINRRTSYCCVALSPVCLNTE
jgi:hypothetical protein